LYSFIIVDDEPEIREGIRDNIPWESLGFRFAGACADGNQALELIEREPPDVVMTDINMPFMDGLTLCERVLSVSPATKVLILTGYDDFDYARKALQLQAQDFLLKPLTPGEFKATLEKLKARLDEEHGARRDMELLKRQLEESLPLLKERFLNQLLAGGGPEASERALRLGLPFPASEAAYHVTLVDFDRRPEGPSFDLDILAERNLIERILDENSGGRGRTAVVFQDAEDRLALLSWTRDGQLLYRDALKTAETIRSRLLRAGFEPVSIGLGEPAASIPLLGESYQGARPARARPQPARQLAPGPPQTRPPARGAGAGGGRGGRAGARGGGAPGRGEKLRRGRRCPS